MSRSSRLLLTLLAFGAAATACSDDRGGAATSPPPPPTTAVPTTVPTSAAASTPTSTAQPALPGAGVTVEVDALDNRFVEPTITIEAGTTVRFVNKGRNDHNVLPAEGDAWGVQQAQFFPEAEYSHAFDTPGTYAYYCSIHGTATVGMTGAITVTAS